MPSLSQLQSEKWWNEEVVTVELDWLGDELCRRTGRPRSAAGTKGNTVHLRGAHRSQAWLLGSRWSTSRTYTVQGGLSAVQLRQIAGFDFTPGSAQEMIAQSRRLRSAMIAGKLDGVLEFYGNVDGDQVVDGWDNLNNRAATSDSSHLWHWHLTIDRRHLNNKALMQSILDTALGVKTVTAPHPKVELVAPTNNALTEMFRAMMALRDGGMVGKSPSHPGGVHWTVDQINDIQHKLDSLLTQVGALTVAVANLTPATTPDPS